MGEDARVSADAGTHPFDADTAVRRLGDGRFAATISRNWDTPAGPNGGYSLATVVRALGQALPHPDPFAVSATFLRPVDHGDAEVVTEVVRSGRRLSVGEARLVQAGTERVRVVATFADLDAMGGPTRDLSVAPQMPDPDRCLLPAEPELAPTEGAPFTIGQRFDYRMPVALGFARGEPSGRTEFDLWMRFREPRDPDTWSMPSFVDGAPPAVMEIGELASTTVELTLHVRRRPAPGWLAMHIATRHVIGGYHEEDVDVWDSTGHLVAQSRQLALLPLR
jgi:acyl-CoA thioesterase